MAVWSDKVDMVDTILAAHVNQLADAMSTANTYDFGGTTTLEQLAASHAAAGAHTNKIVTGDIVDNTIDPLDLEAKCLATRQGSSPSASGKGRILIETALKNTYCDSEGSWQAIIIGTANVSSDVAGSALTGGDGDPLNVNVGSGLEVSSDAIRIAAAAAGDGLTGGAGSPLAVGAGNGISVAADAVAVKYDDSTIGLNIGGTLGVKDSGIGPDQIATTIAGDGLTGGAASPLEVVAGAGLEISSNAVRIAAAAAGAGLTGGAGNALAVGAGDGITVNADDVAVKHDNATLAITAGTLHVKDAGIGTAQWAAALVPLASGAEVKTLHKHPYWTCIAADHVASTAQDTDAAAMPQYSKLGDDNDVMTFWRTTYVHQAGIGTVQLRCLYDNNGTVDARIRVFVGADSSGNADLTGTTEKAVAVNVTSVGTLVAGDIHPLFAQLLWPVGGLYDGTLTVGTISVWAHGDTVSS